MKTRYEDDQTYAVLGKLVSALLGGWATGLQDIQHTLLIRGHAGDLTDYLAHDLSVLAEALQRFKTK